MVSPLKPVLHDTDIKLRCQESFYRITRKRKWDEKRKWRQKYILRNSMVIFDGDELKREIRVTPKISSNIKIDAPKFDKMVGLLPHLVVRKKVVLKLPKRIIQ
ncbi:hypothetical protein NPIL_386721 [Nephila pilipes]|uniref:Uncharacterized protein n=1 Tax=Nephila pilipes TaxID=299642 RepID=A0A8X6NAH0_NEPPI|nr:hypothetical protein NPIL_386721 [Nephila pilipes]